MPRQVIRIEGRPLLDIASYARRGPRRRDHLSQADIELIERTVTRTPEVMVKVLSRGGQNLKAVQGHLAYLSRKGELDLETDDGRSVAGNGEEAALLKDWDLDIETDRRQSSLAPTNNRQPPKLVHKLMFSMPPGTPPDKVLQAVRNFAREEFALKHRYAMVLHTDEPHPHVHMIVKAVSEQGERLNIRKATLRGWRQEFARHLRALGVAANATERAVRGEGRISKSDGIYRAMLRGNSTHMHDRVTAIARELSKGYATTDRDNKSRLRETRNEINEGWSAAATILRREGALHLSKQVDQFLQQMEPPRTEKEQLVHELQNHVRHRERSQPRSTR